MGILQRNSSWLSDFSNRRLVRFAASNHQRGRAFILSVAVWAVLATTTVAAEYPDRPIRLIVASAPGGQPDINARMFAAELGKRIIKRTGAKVD